MDIGILSVSYSNIERECYVVPISVFLILFDKPKDFGDFAPEKKMRASRGPLPPRTLNAYKPVLTLKNMVAFGIYNSVYIRQFLK